MLSFVYIKKLDQHAQCMAARAVMHTSIDL